MAGSRALRASRWRFRASSWQPFPTRPRSPNRPRQPPQRPREEAGQEGRRRRRRADAAPVRPTRRIRDLDRERRRRRRRRHLRASAAAQGLAAAAAADAPSRCGARAARRARPTRTRSRPRTTATRSRASSSTTTKTSDAHARRRSTARSTSRRRPARRARRGDQAPRGVRRSLPRHQRAPREHARRDVPPRRALRGARARRATRPTISSIGLKQAIALYKRVIQRVPEVPRARRHLLLPRPRAQRLEPHRRGAAGVALARLPQQVPVPGRRADPKDPEQGHDRPHAAGSRRGLLARLGERAPDADRLREAAAAAKAARRRKKGAVDAPVDAARRATSTRIPTAASAIPQQTTTAPSRGTSPRSGGRSATGTSTSSIPHGGPYNLNRAATAYQQSMKFKKPPLYGVAMYKLAWTYFKQQRYETASTQFVDLLNYTDEQEKHRRSGHRLPRRGVHVHRRLAHVPRLRGPRGRRAVHRAQRHPRHRVEPARSPSRRCTSRSTACRIRKLIPQDKKWTVEIYKALAQEFREVNQWHNAIEVERAHPQEVADEPRRAGHAEPDRRTSTTSSTRLSREGTPERDQNAREGARGAHQARGLRRQHAVGRRQQGRPRGDPDRRAPRATAASAAPRPITRTSARAYVGKATETQRRGAAADLVSSARSPSTSSPTSAGRATSRRTRTRPTPTRAASGSPTRATASSSSRVNRDRVAAEPRRDRRTRAQAAVDVRDSNEDDKFLAARRVLRRRRRRAVAARSVPLCTTRTERRAGHREARRSAIRQRRRRQRPGRWPIRSPPCVQAIMAARDEYVQRVPAGRRRPEERPIVYEFQVGRLLLPLRSFDEAKARFEPIWKDHCGKNEFGYKAWEKLITMAARSLDVEGEPPARRGAKSSTLRGQRRADQRSARADRPVKIGGAYIDAGNALPRGREDEGRPRARARSGARRRRPTSSRSAAGGAAATRRPRPR